MRIQRRQGRKNSIHSIHVIRRSFAVQREKAAFGCGDDVVAVGCCRGMILTGRAAVAVDGMARRSEKLGDA